MRALLLFCLLLAATLHTTAQWHEADPVLLFQRFEGRMHPRPADSVDFARFGEALARTALDIGPLPELSEYRLGCAMRGHDHIGTRQRHRPADLLEGPA